MRLRMWCRRVFVSLVSACAIVAMLGVAAGTARASGLTWAAPVLVDGQPLQALSGVSCVSRSLCVAVDAGGNVLRSTDPGGAGAWSATAVDTGEFYCGYHGTPGQCPLSLSGVSCPSASLCVAVDNAGNGVISTDPTAATPTWSAPTVIDTPNDLYGEGQNLRVSCASTSLCVAVDDQGSAVITTNPTATKPTWSAPANIDANGSAVTDGLTDVSCPWTSLCVAVDALGNAVITTNPTAAKPTWRTTNVDANGLTGVSCPSTSLCVALDSQGNAVIATNPTAAKPAWRKTHGINGPISCPSTSLCVAVDAHGNAVTTTNPTAAKPTWSTPTSVDANGVAGVSCPSTSSCVAVDDAGNVVVGHGSGVAPPSNISSPTIPGSAVEGLVLGEVHASWTGSPTSFSYQWQDCDSTGGTCEPIAGATSRAYTVTGSDIGHTIRVQESARNAGGSGGVATSVQTAVVIAPSAAQIRASLLHEITPHGNAAKIAALVKKHRYVLSFRALSAGSVAIDWYHVSNGAHLASAKPKPVLVAGGKATFARTGMMKITIKLTASGERLLKHANRITLTAQATFTPATAPAIVATRTFTLTR
jgi:hypothetical protein